MSIARDVLEALDADGDGVVNLEEALAEGFTQKQFEAMDKDGNGTVDKQELKIWIKENAKEAKKINAVRIAKEKKVLRDAEKERKASIKLQKKQDIAAEKERKASLKKGKKPVGPVEPEVLELLGHFCQFGSESSSYATEDCMVNLSGAPRMPMAMLLAIIDAMKDGPFPGWKSLFLGATKNEDGTYRVLTQQMPGPMTADFPAVGPLSHVEFTLVSELVKTEDLKNPVEWGTFALNEDKTKVADVAYTLTSHLQTGMEGKGSESVEAIWGKAGDGSDVSFSAHFKLMGVDTQPFPAADGGDDAVGFPDDAYDNIEDNGRSSLVDPTLAPGEVLFAEFEKHPEPTPAAVEPDVQFKTKVDPTAKRGSFQELFDGTLQDPVARPEGLGREAKKEPKGVVADTVGLSRRLSTKLTPVLDNSKKPLKKGEQIAQHEQSIALGNADGASTNTYKPDVLGIQADDKNRIRTMAMEKHNEATKAEQDRLAKLGPEGQKHRVGQPLKQVQLSKEELGARATEMDAEQRDFDTFMEARMAEAKSVRMAKEEAEYERAEQLRAASIAAEADKRKSAISNKKRAQLEAEQKAATKKAAADSAMEARLAAARKRQAQMSALQDDPTAHLAGARQ